jgi:poly(ADP-ribose) glycohydrolase
MSSNTLEYHLQQHEQSELIRTIRCNYPNSNLSVLKYYLEKNSSLAPIIRFIRTLAVIKLDHPKWDNNKLELSQLQVAHLLAKSFLCMNKNQYDCIVIFDKLSDPIKPMDVDPIEYYKQLMLSNPLDPDEMFDLSIEKLKFLFNYFASIRDQPLTESILITKIDNKFDLTTDMNLSTIKLSSIEFVSGYMNYSDPIKVDFANKNIGGGVLKHGCCQEEIMFLTNPELIGIMSLVDTLGPTQAIIVDGITQYSKAINYGFDLRYDNKDYSFDSKY